eukprot:128946_1
MLPQYVYTQSISPLHTPPASATPTPLKPDVTHALKDFSAIKIIKYSKCKKETGIHYHLNNIIITPSITSSITSCTPFTPASAAFTPISAAVMHIMFVDVTYLYVFFVTYLYVFFVTYLYVFYISPTSTIPESATSPIPPKPPVSPIPASA